MIARFIPFARAVRAQIGQDHRFAHTVRVARLADRLAQAHGEDRVRARTAGMLHDLARLYDEQTLLEGCAARKIEIGDFERRHPIVLHAPLGAALARERFGIEDQAILNAITRHTLGAPQMSRLDAIVYLADALEPGRTFERREAFIDHAFRGLEDAMVAVIAASIGYLRSRNLEIAPQTLATLTYYESLGKEAKLCPT